MKRILFWMLGSILLAIGLLGEGLIVRGLFAAFINGWAILAISVIVFSIIIGNVIYKYGFKYDDSVYQENNKDISL